MAEFNASQIKVEPAGPQVFSASDIASTPKERSFADAVANAGEKFWDWTGKPVAMAMGIAPGGRGGKAAVAAQKQIISGIMNEPARVRSELTNALDAFVAGNPRATLHHVLTAVPVVGEGINQAAQEFNKGDTSSGVGHMAAILAPAVAREVPPAAKAIADASGPALDVAKGAIKEGVKAGLAPVTYGHLKIPVPSALAGAATGGWAGGQLGIPHAIGAAVGAATPIVRGMIKGGKAVLEGAPEPPPGFNAATGSTTGPIPAAQPYVPTPQPPVGGVLPNTTFPSTEPPGFSIGGGTTAGPIPASQPQGPIVQPPVGGALPGQVFEGSVPAASAADAGLLDDLAQGYGLKSFAKATAEQQATIRDLAARISKPNEAPPQAPAAPVAQQAASQPVAPVEEPQPPTAPVKTIAEQIADDIKARRGAEPAPPATAPTPKPTKAKSAPAVKLPEGSQRVDTPMGMNGTPAGTLPTPSPNAVINPAPSVPAAPPVEAQVPPTAAVEPPVASQPSPAPVVPPETTAPPAKPYSQMTKPELEQALGLPENASTQDWADALFEEAQRSGTAVIDGKPQAAPPDPTALADMAREVPQTHRKAVADANYRAVKEGNAEQNTASPVYEATNRAVKVEPVVKALMDHGVTYDDMTKLTPSEIESYANQLSAATAAEGGQHPGNVFSKLSVDELLGELRRAEEAKK